MPLDRGGPLSGVRVIELAGIGAAPFAVMMLADAGAEVLRIDRPASVGTGEPDLIERGRRKNAVTRGRRSVVVDLKNPEGRDLVLALVRKADVLIESFRPGVAERLGLGPQHCLEENPALVYGRLTGWGSSGELADRAGHDINYLALSGVLSMIGSRGGPPVVPLNLLADFGGGGMVLAFGILAALLAARTSGRGQVVDAAMVDGAVALATYVYSMRSAGTWIDQRGSNVLDGGAPFYGVYSARDGQYFAVGAIERKFYESLLEGLGLEEANLPDQLDRAHWVQLRRAIEDAFSAQPGHHWRKVFSERDACVTPVLSPGEAETDPHLSSRQTFTTLADMLQPAPVPRFDRPAAPPDPPVEPGERGREGLRDWGLEEAEVGALIARAVIQVRPSARP